MKSLYTREYKIFIDLLKKYRKEKYITQKELGKRLGIDQTYVSKYETLERRLDFIEFRNICLKMGIDLFEFIEKFEKELKNR